MLNRLFRKRDPDPSAADNRVRAEPDFEVEGKALIAKAVVIYWQQSGALMKLRLRRNLRPPEVVVTRDNDGFGVDLHRGETVEKQVARGLDFATASDLHRVIWNWLGQLCQNGHDTFPRALTPPAHGFAHDHWPETGAS